MCLSLMGIVIYHTDRMTLLLTPVAVPGEFSGTDSFIEKDFIHSTGC